MPDKITTLKLVDNTDVFPNIKDENIPNTIMRVTDLSKYLNQLKSINITGDIDSTTITSDIATFTTADITTLNVSGASHFEGEATFGRNIHVDGNLVVNGIDNIVDKGGNKIVRNESLDEFTSGFYNTYDVSLYMNKTIRNFSNIYGINNVLVIPYSDKITNLSSFCQGAQVKDIFNNFFRPVVIPDVSNPVESKCAFQGFGCENITFNNITLVNPTFCFMGSNVTSINVADGKNAKITGGAIYCFAFCSDLTEIGKFDMSEAGDLGHMLVYSSSLKKLHCTHWKSSFDISSSTAFEQSDLVEIISNLDSVSTAKTLTMGSTNLAKLTQEQILVATGKGWTLA